MRSGKKTTECWCVMLIAGVVAVSDSTEEERVVTLGWGLGGFKFEDGGLSFHPIYFT